MSTKYAAQGVVLKAGAAASPTTIVDGLKEIQFTGGERQMIDVTNHNSSTAKEQIPAKLRAARGLEFTIFYDPADTQHERMRAACEAKTLEYLTVVLPDLGTAQWAFSGYYTNFSLPTLGTENAIEATVSFQATAVEVFTQ